MSPIYPGSVLQIGVNTYVNPEELGGNQSRILCLSCCWKELHVVFLHVLKGKARTSSFLLFQATRTMNICMATLTTKAYTLIIFLAVRCNQSFM